MASKSQSRFLPARKRTKQATSSFSLAIPSFANSTKQDSDSSINLGLGSDNMSRVQERLKQLPPVEFQLPTGAEEFTVFHRLPIELRLRIWKFAAHQPHDIRLHLPIKRYPMMPYELSGRNKVPSILPTCRESRNESLKHYTKCNERSEEFPSMATREKTVYVNFNSDQFVHTFICTIPRNNYSGEIHDWPVFITGYNFDIEVLREIKHFTVDYASCACDDNLQRLKAFIELDRSSEQLEEVTLKVGLNKPLDFCKRVPLRELTDEDIRRGLMEFWLGMTKTQPNSYKWCLPFQVECGMEENEVLRVRSEDLKEYLSSQLLLPVETFFKK